VCEWSDRLHHLFGAGLREKVFVLMCVKARQEAEGVQPQLPMQLWLGIFQPLAEKAIAEDTDPIDDFESHFSSEDDEDDSESDADN
jgi:hypothetical protein